MGLLEAVGAVTRMARGGGGGSAPLFDSVGELLAKGDGLHGVLAKLDDAGLGDVARSWVAKGKNLPISAEQIQRVLGSEQVAAIAGKLGIAPEAAAAKLSKLLPQVVDRVTTDGAVPAQEDVAARVAAMRRP